MQKNTKGREREKLWFEIGKQEIFESFGFWGPLVWTASTMVFQVVGWVKAQLLPLELGLLKTADCVRPSDIIIIVGSKSRLVST